MERLEIEPAYHRDYRGSKATWALSWAANDRSDRGDLVRTSVKNGANATGIGKKIVWGEVRNFFYRVTTSGSNVVLLYVNYQVRRLRSSLLDGQEGDDSHHSRIKTSFTIVYPGTLVLPSGSLSMIWL